MGLTHGFNDFYYHKYIVRLLFSFQSKEKPPCTRSLCLLVLCKYPILVSSKISRKALLIFVFTIIICGIEWISDWVGILEHKDWKLRE